MTQTESQPETRQAGGQGSGQGSGQGRRQERQPASRSATTGALESSQGRTTVATSVVTKIAAIATREVSGVHELGGGASRAFGALRERIPGSGGPSTSQGVSVEVGEKQAAVDLVVVVEYGVPITEVAKGVRDNVINSVENMTGLEIVEVNISVVDVYIPGGDSEEPKSARVE